MKLLKRNPITPTWRFGNQILWSGPSRALWSRSSTWSSQLKFITAVIIRPVHQFKQQLNNDLNWGSIIWTNLAFGRPTSLWWYIPFAVFIVYRTVNRAHNWSAWVIWFFTFNKNVTLAESWPLCLIGNVLMEERKEYFSIQTYFRALTEFC